MLQMHSAYTSKIRHYRRLSLSVYQLEYLKDTIIQHESTHVVRRRLSGALELSASTSASLRHYRMP